MRGGTAEQLFSILDPALLSLSQLKDLKALSCQTVSVPVCSFTTMNHQACKEVCIISASWKFGWM